MMASMKNGHGALGKKLLWTALSFTIVYQGLFHISYKKVVTNENQRRVWPHENTKEAFQFLDEYDCLSKLDPLYSCFDCKNIDICPNLISYLSSNLSTEGGTLKIAFIIDVKNFENYFCYPKEVQNMFSKFYLRTTSALVLKSHYLSFPSDFHVELLDEDILRFCESADIGKRNRLHHERLFFYFKTLSIDDLVKNTGITTKEELKRLTTSFAKSAISLLHCRSVPESIVQVHSRKKCTEIPLYEDVEELHCYPARESGHAFIDSYQSTDMADDNEKERKERILGTIIFQTNDTNTESWSVSKRIYHHLSVLINHRTKGLALAKQKIFGVGTSFSLVESFVLSVSLSFQQNLYSVTFLLKWILLTATYSTVSVEGMNRMTDNILEEFLAVVPPSSSENYTETFQSTRSSAKSLIHTNSSIQKAAIIESNLIATGDLGLRYFPHVFQRSESSIPYPPIPDCVANHENVGCVPMPKSHQSAPYWAGKIHVTPPSCDEMKKNCEQGVPMSVKAYSLSEHLVSINPFVDNTVIELPTIGIPYGLAVVDVNGDSMVDIIIGNDGQENQLLLNDGDGGYLEAVNLPGGKMNTYPIAAADVNNDGMVDLVIGNYDPNQKNQLLLNEGDGSFSEALDLPGGLMPTWSISIADVNGDGMLDIIIGNGAAAKSDEIQPNQLLLNNGEGGYLEAINLPGGDMGTSLTAAADVNNDGMVDIIIVGNSQKNQLLLNDGNGNYPEAVDLPGGNMISSSIAVADLNNDGTVDIIVGNAGQNNQLLLNNGDGTFSQALDLPGGATDTEHITIADVDGDGIVDILIANNNRYNQLLINQGGGRFSGDISLPGGFNTFRMEAADINRDGMVDIIMNDVQSIQLLINKGNGDYSAVANLPGDTKSTSTVVLADINADGMLDTIVGNSFPDRNYLMMNQGDGSFSEIVDLPGGALDTPCIAAGDLNKDGAIDIVIGNKFKSNQLLINQGSGNFIEQVINLPGGFMDTRDMVSADINGDGLVDVLIGNFGQNQLLLNEGNGKFSEAIDLPGGESKTWSIAVGDVNDDGMMDIILGNEGSANQLLLNQGNSSFSHAIDLPGEGIFTISIVAADMNGDGTVDIIAGDWGTANQLLLNDGHGTFFDVIDLPGGSMVTGPIHVSDMNGDGMLDILIGNMLEQPNQLIINQGDGNFSEAFELPGGMYESWIILAVDVNNDGMMDIVVGNSYGQTNQLLLNQGNNLRNFEVITLPAGSMLTSYMTAEDVNGDGMVDILYGYQKNQLLINQGDGRNYEVFDLPAGFAYTSAIEVVDINDDGMVDILFGNWYWSNQLLINQGNGRYSKVVVDLPGGVLDTESIVLADFNGDGNLDILVGNFRQINQLLINQGDGTMFEVFDLPGGALDTVSLAVADVDGDNMIDVFIGNDGQPNQLLLNDGNGSFIEVIDLPGNYSNTKFVAAADVNNDGFIDAIICNNGQPNQLLINQKDNEGFDEIDLPGGSRNSYSVAVADMDGDGMVDILFGSYGQPNQLLKNLGGGTFTEALGLPGGALNTVSIVPGDLNGDGMLDIVIGNIGEGKQIFNQLLLFDSCPNGGAQLHSKSWCFKCPNFMGRDLIVSDQKNYFCRECMPDYEQDSRGSERCEVYTPCALKQRKLGEDICVRCQDGTYYNNTISRDVNDPSTWATDRCELCPAGTYAAAYPIAIDGCFPCSPGTHQPSIGSGTCLACSPGSFQPDFGKESCEPCSKGGYCDSSQKIDGGFTACPPGTFNDKLGQSNISACISCPPGTYSTVNGAESSATCLPCPSGTFNDQLGKISCTACDLGTFQDKRGQESCNSCPSGTYADKTGFEECIVCPYRLASINSSSTCSFCAQGFYLNDVHSTISKSDIFQDPVKYCLECPLIGASCEANMTLSKLDIRPGHWRHSNRTSTIYPCNKSSKVCKGSRASVDIRDKIQIDDFGDIYCKLGHEGPLCEVCVDESSYFSVNHGECMECPSGGRIIVLLTSIAFGITGTVIILGLFFVKFRLQVYMQNMITGISFQAKVKLIVSFCQILSSLEDTYGVRLDSAFTVWMKIISYLSLDLLQIVGIPPSCITSSTRQQLAFGALWPFMIVLVGAILGALYKAHSILSQSNGENVKSHLKRWTIYGAIVVIYFAIPTVSRSIFDAIKCRAFDDDDQGSSVSYLLIDMNVKCDRTDNDTYDRILVLFWALFTVWIVLIPLIFLVLLAYIHPSVQSKSITSLADSCRFLWQDYDPSMIYWDVVDTLRKIFLTGFIMLVDKQEGSNKILRLVIAGVVSVFYSFILLALRPYKRQDDYNLAFLSNFFLICCFLMGFILKLCGEDDEPNDDNGNNISFCSRFIGEYFDSYRASLMVVLLTFSMLILTTIFMVILAIKKVQEPIVYMASTGHPPDLELPKGCSYHMFMSHVWGTGQAQTHAIVRKLQLFMPGLKVWLDVDELTDISNLEESVSDSAVFVMYYSSGYFRSKNCRREIYTAITLEKPIIVLYKDDSTESADKMIEECVKNCNNDDSPGLSLILEKIFGSDGAIQWLDGGGFSAASLDLIYYRILRNLPYYKKHPNELSSKGIMVPGEVEIMPLLSTIKVLVCNNNHGCLGIAEELKSMVSERSPNSIIIFDAEEFLNNYEKEDPNEREEELDGSNSLIHQKNIDDGPTFLLLYLNKFTFDANSEQNADIETIIESCINISNIHLVLVHEQDALKGGCKFDDFFKVTPQKLINEPYNLYREMAIPLYRIKEYRDTSLKMIINKMSGSDPNLGKSILGRYGESMKKMLSQMAGGSMKKSRIQGE